MLQLLVPLLIMLLAFSTFAGEREQGTLRQLLSLGVRRHTLVAGKALGVAGALGLLLAPATLVGVLALALLLASPKAMASSAPRMVVMGAGYLLYFGGFVGVALAVSARARTARTALVTLLGFWIVNTLVAPRLVADVSRRLHPTPSAFAFGDRLARELENGTNGHNPRDKRLADLKVRVLRRYNVAWLEELPVSFEGIALQEGEDFSYPIFDRHFARLYDTYERQENVQRAGALAAPLLAVRFASMGLAGTDIDQHKRFTLAAETYRRALIKIINDDVIHHAKTGLFVLRLRARRNGCVQDADGMKTKSPARGQQAARGALDTVQRKAGG